MYRCATVNNTALCESAQCRCDAKYAIFVSQDNWNAFHSNTEFQTVADVLERIEIKKVPKGSLDDELYLINISDQQPQNGILDYDNIESVSELNSDKTLLTGSDIIISKLGMPKGYIYLLPDMDANVIGSTEFIPYRIKNSSNEMFILYLLLTSNMRNAYRCLETGKTPSHKRVNPEEFLKIRIPSIDKLSDLEKANSVIKDIFDRIVLLQARIDESQRIIDSVFQNEFSFDYCSFESLKNKTINWNEATLLANNPDLRFSVKFHREAGEFVMSQLTAVTDKKIKHFLSEPIVLGASVSPDDYSEDGEFFYISMATIKEWSFNPEGANTVSKVYSDAKSEKTVRKNDIILARSGEGTIGKVALINDDDVQGVFADFTMRIRLKNYNPEFAYYYFRTSYFQYLIEIYKKGLGNNTNIFPIVIQEFPLIDISLEEQQRIVDEIHAEIAKQDAIKAEIADLRSQIDKIIEDTICVDA